MVEAKKTQMEYRYLGGTGLKVSILSWGNMITIVGQQDKQQFMNDSVKRCIEHGINFFDTAEMYGFGEAENLLGHAFKAVGVKREEIVVSTKVFFGAGEGRDTGVEFRFGSYYRTIGINQSGLSRKHVIEGALGGLRRLQLDYVDIIFAHRPDRSTPLEEICRAFSWLIDNNKAFYWGTSEWDVETIAEAIQLCQRLGLHAPVAEQCQYNMLNRKRVEKEYRSLFEKYSFGTTVWSPLAQGFLSGKYNDGKIPEDSRVTKWDPFWSNWLQYEYFSGEKKEKLIKVCLGLAEIAKAEGYSQAQLALAWCLASRDVSTVILGISKLDQLDENVKAVELYQKWNKTLEGKIEGLIQNPVDPTMEFRTFTPAPQRREIAVFGEKK
jgi:voltage-dependent potassium channel beta subunit